MKLRKTLMAIACLGIYAASPLVLAEETYDLVISGGRVVDPETGLDAVRHVGVSGGEITAISEKPLTGKRTIDATGKVVSPGFIDLHAHGQNILSARMQALDGVTTALDLEAGILPVSDFYERAEREGRPINYGVSVSWASARISAFYGVEPEADLKWLLAAFAKPEWQKQLASDAQLDAILAKVEAGLDHGGLGIGVLLGYAPGTGAKEFYALNEVAAKRGVPIVTHPRHLSVVEPDSSFEAIAEIISYAASTGGHAHIVHLNSSTLRDIKSIGPLIQSAQHNGVKITTEAYPYGAGSTGIGAAMFRAENWRNRMGGLSARNFDVDGKRLTEAKFEQLQSFHPGTETIVHLLELSDPDDRAALDTAVLFPEGVVASDGGDWLIDGQTVPQNTWPIPGNAWSHPRGAATYATFLSHYVREEKALSLLEAIKRIAFRPAQILENAVPQMRHKGRLQVGADADLVIFDLDNVQPNATYEKPAQPSSGFDHVIVGGVVLVEGGNLRTNTLPGKAIRNKQTPVAD